MSRTAAEILKEVRQLPAGDFDWLVQNLLPEGESMTDEEFAAWQKEAGEPEPGYEEWFRAGVEEALADTSGDVSHEEMVREFRAMILRARLMLEVHLVFGPYDLVVALGEVRAWTPTRQPVWRPALQFWPYKIMRSRYEGTSGQVSLASQLSLRG